MGLERKDQTLKVLSKTEFSKRSFKVLHRKLPNRPECECWANFICEREMFAYRYTYTYRYTARMTYQITHTKFKTATKLFVYLMYQIQPLQKYWTTFIKLFRTRPVATTIGKLVSITQPFTFHKHSETLENKIYRNCL